MPAWPVLLALTAIPPHLAATRVERAPHIDGLLTEPVWSTATASDAFTQRLPHEGKPPSERTVVRVLYDDDAMYVGVECEQRAPVVARVTRRDREVESDWVSVALDTRGTGKSAFEFRVSAAGVLLDAIRLNDTDISLDWDENWEAKAGRTARGWSAELKIPLRILRFSELPAQSWGLQVRRRVSALAETDEWAYIPRALGGEVSRYGRLEGVRGLRASQSIELRPFVVVRSRHHDPQADTLARGAELDGSAGIDVRWHLTGDLTLDATLNPDFGQVEADQVVLNLSNYETLFPEKRPFFLEGLDTFDTPVQLIYTRRIGRAPEPPALLEDAPAGERPVEAPDAATIYGASKLVGDLGGGVSIGQLVAVTAPQRVEVEGSDGRRVERLAEPLTSFKALRVRKDFGEAAHVGAMVLSTNRLEQGAVYPVDRSSGAPLLLCPNEEAQRLGGRCFHDAYVGSVDARWRPGRGDWVVAGQALGSLIDGGAPRTLPDGTVVASGDADVGAFARIAKDGGEHWIGRAEYRVAGRRLDYNDLGYMPRQNVHSVNAFVGYRTLEPWWVTLETETDVAVYDEETLDLTNLGRGVDLNTWWKLANNWAVYAEVHWRPARFDDREIGDGAALERAGLVGFELAFDTDTRKAVSAGLFAQLQPLENGLAFYGEGKVTFHALPELDVELLPNVVHTRGEPRYVSTEPVGYVFGRLLASGIGLTVRSTYTFLPNLTLQGYAQAFLAAERYYDYSSAPAGGDPVGRVIRLDDLAPAPRPAESPDFHEGTLNASFVWRWEYRLGSTLFLVYSHSQATPLSPGFGAPSRPRLRLLEPRIAADVFLAKLSWWWAG